MIADFISITVSAVLAVVIINFLLQGYDWQWKRLLPGGRRYNKADLKALPKGIIPVQIGKRLRKGHVHFLPPETGENVDIHLWVLYSGRTGNGIRWFKHLAPLGLKNNGYLAMDYPGYGKMPGCPSMANIQAATKTALTQVGGIYGRKMGDNTWWTAEGRSISVAGYSIGAAVALEFAKYNPVRRVVLLAPFTNVKEVIKIHHGGWAAMFFRKSMIDNVAAMKQVLAKPQPPEIIIIHDPQDTYIPNEMVEELHRIDPENIRIIQVPEAGHDHLMSDMTMDQRRDLFQFST